MRNSSKNPSSKDERLLKKIRELEEELADSVPKAEFDAVKLNLQLEIDDLQRRLSDSVPRADFEYVKSELQRIWDLQGRYAVPGGETEELRARIIELEKLFQSAPRPNTEQDSRVSIDEIQLPKSAPKGEREAESERELVEM